MSTNIKISLAVVVVLIIIIAVILATRPAEPTCHVVSEPYYANAVSSSRLLREMTITQPGGNKRIHIGEIKLWSKSADGKLVDVSSQAQAMVGRDFITSVFDGDSKTAFDTGDNSDTFLSVGFLKNSVNVVKVEFLNTKGTLNGADVVMGNEDDGQEWIYKYTLGKGENLVININ